MRKWAFLTVAAAIVVIGCAGGGGSDSTSGGVTNSGSTTGTALRVNIPTPQGFQKPPGFLEFGYLTGQGRAIGDLTLVITRASVTDSEGEVKQDLATELALSLGSYTFQIRRLTVPFTSQNPNSRLFETYTLDPLKILEDTGGTPLEYDADTCFVVQRADGSINRAWPPNPTEIVARVFPGRSTMVPIFLDDSMFRVESDPGNFQCNGTSIVFDEERFRALNEPPIRGFINDYVGFDISGVPDGERPRMSDGTVVNRVYTTGDNFAVSSAGDFGTFEMLTLQVSQPVIGTYRVPGSIGGSTLPGTFTLRQLDPTDLFNLRKIVALQGIWRNYTTVISGLDTWNMVTFPTTNDNNEQEAVFFRRDGNGAITSFFFGFVDLDTNEGHFFPVKTLVTGISIPAEEVVISITGEFTASGSVSSANMLTRSGTYSVTTSGGLPGDAPTSGSFLVFRV